MLQQEIFALGVHHRAPIRRGQPRPADFAGTVLPLAIQVTGTADRSPRCQPHNGKRPAPPRGLLGKGLVDPATRRLTRLERGMHGGQIGPDLGCPARFIEVSLMLSSQRFEAYMGADEERWCW